MTTEKIQEIAQLFASNTELTAEEVMNGYIFWPYANNEHYLVWEIYNIKDTVQALTYTVVTDEPTAEEPPVEEPTLSLEEVVANTLWITLPTESVE